MVIGTVTKVPCDAYFYVKNGDPKEIMCHCSRSGNIQLSPMGRLAVELCPRSEVLPINTKVALLRATEDQNSKDFTKALCWVTMNELHAANREILLRTTFRAYGTDHRTSGKMQSDGDREVLTIEDTLENILKNCTGERYHSNVGRLMLSCKLSRWERRDLDGTWTECGDPRVSH